MPQHVKLRPARSGPGGKGGVPYIKSGGRGGGRHIGGHSCGVPPSNPSLTGGGRGGLSLLMRRTHSMRITRRPCSGPSGMSDPGSPSLYSAANVTWPHW